MFAKIVIKDSEGEKYLTRWILLRKFGYKIYLHHIHTSDDDRHLHDHPWPFISFLLWGSYIEYEHPELMSNTFAVGERVASAVRWLNLRLRPHVPHCLELKRPVWTLVFGGRKVRDWGFMTPEGFIHHKKYLDSKFGPGNWIDETSQYD